MASDNAVVMSAANLDVIENSMTQLANNLSQVNVGMYAVDTKINDVTASVRTIEEEIKSFMEEIRGSSITSNAKQSIMLNQAELDKKFGHYDRLRRNVNGLLQASDMSAVTRESVQKISEEVIVGIPNYWLAPAFVALSAWLTDDKDLAERALKEAMARDDEKTSLMFALIHARAGRNNTATMWLSRYLEMQDPTQMEPMIIVVLDAISNGVFGLDGKNLITQKLDQWFQELNQDQKYKLSEIERIKNHLESFKEAVPDRYPFIENFTDGSDNIYASLSSNYSRTKVFNYFQNVFAKAKLDSNKKVKVDEILDSLVFNYESAELDLKKDIYKNKLIVEENGNITKANKRFSESEIAYEKSANLFAILNNVCLDLTESSQETKKLCLALCKDLFITAYKEAYSDVTQKEHNFNINLDNISLNTTNGQNQKELMIDLDRKINNNIQEEIAKIPLFDFKMLISTILGIAAIFFTLKIPVLAIIVGIVVIGFNAFNIMGALNQRTKIRKSILERRTDYQKILISSIAEIVDYQFITNNGKHHDEQIYNYLNNLNYKDYLTADVKRNILIGGTKNE